LQGAVPRRQLDLAVDALDRFLDPSVSLAKILSKKFGHLLWIVQVTFTKVNSRAFLATKNPDLEVLIFHPFVSVVTGVFLGV
jgi:hypothetical protein